MLWVRVLRFLGRDGSTFGVRYCSSAESAKDFAGEEVINIIPKNAKRRAFFSIFHRADLIILYCSVEDFGYVVKVTVGKRRCEIAIGWDMR